MEITSERVTIFIAIIGFILAGISFAYNVKSEVTVLKIELQSNRENDKKKEEDIKGLSKECKRINSRVGQVAQGLVAVEADLKHLNKKT